jgi:hypothetical protein
VIRVRREYDHIRPGGEEGVTLVELLLSMTIMALIIGPLSAGLIIGLRTAGETNTRLAGSADAQLLSIELPPDIASAGKLPGDVVVSTTANTECSGATNSLRLRWTAGDTGAAVTYQAAYFVTGTTQEGWKLRRAYCVDGAAAITRTVARNLASATAASSTISGNRVSMTVTEAVSAANPTPYTFTISGNRRTI